MTIKLGIIMDAIESIKVHHDTSLAMLLEAQNRGWTIQYMQQHDLFIADSVAKARMTELKVYEDNSHWFDFGKAKTANLDTLDIILMRKDPPFNAEYVYSTQILDHAKKSGVLVVNDPQSLRDANEKIFTTHFPEISPPTLVARDKNIFHEFLQKHKHIVLKPLDNMGGRSVFVTQENDPNFNVIIETLTKSGESFAMAQKYLPAIAKGDKRIILINGEPIEYALLRMPAKGEIRANLAAGGTGTVVKITDRDRLICKTISETLKQKNLLFVGIDVIGDYLTEINVTSPTCVREIEAEHPCGIMKKFFDVLEKKLNGDDA